MDTMDWMFPTADPNVCCFCGKPLGEYDRNNPDPACTLDNANCCRNCDERIVLPARIAITKIINNALSKKKVSR